MKCVDKHTHLRPHTLTELGGKSAAHVYIICRGRAEADRVVTYIIVRQACAMSGPLST